MAIYTALAATCKASERERERRRRGEHERNGEEVGSFSPRCSRNVVPRVRPSSETETKEESFARKSDGKLHQWRHVSKFILLDDPMGYPACIELPSPTSLYQSTLHYTDEPFEYFKGCETLKQPWNTCALVAPTSGTARRNLGYPR
ncbi:hypothetical protein ANTQUA_LOCUS9492 [Anthophora quadrimaculata]